MDKLRQDLRYAIRQLMKHRGFTAIAVLTLALGIGANTVMFSVVDALFLSPPPGVHEPEDVKRIYIVRDEGNMRTTEGGPGMYADMRDIRTGSRAFSSVAGQTWPGDMDLGRGESARQVTGLVVTGSYFQTLGARPALGRFFGPVEDTIPASFVTVVSHSFWENRLGANPEAIGQQIRLSGDMYTIVGVAPEHFRGIDTDAVDVWLPASAARGEDFLTDRNYIGLNLFGRLAPGVQPERAIAEASAAMRHAASEFEQLDPTPSIILGPLNSELGPHRSQTGTVSLWLGLVTGLVLLIACANVANLLLSRATQRRREIAVRIAIGAGRRRLLRQLLTESVFLALLGGVGALLLTLWSTELIALFPLPPLPSLLDVRILGFTLGVSVLTGIVFGILPTLQASRFNLLPALRDGAPSEGSSRSRVRSGLLIVQVAISLVLLVAAGLLVRSLAEARSVELGLDAGNLLYASVDLEDAGYADDAANAFLDRALQRILALPGVVAADVAAFEPLGGSAMALGAEAPGREPEYDGEGPYANFVGPDFFQATGSAVLTGRAFTDADREGGAPVVILNERMANLYWPAGDALGECLEITDGVCSQVVGVVESIRHDTLDEEPVPKYYIPLSQQAGRGAWSGKTIILRTSGDPEDMIVDVRRSIQGLAANLPFVSVIPVTSLIAPDLRPYRLGATLFSLFGVLALLLASIGLYGVVTFTVVRQTREIGVRIALGAGRTDVLRLVVARAMAVTFVGVLIGLAGAFAVTRFMESLLYGVEVIDPVTFASVPLILLTVALIAAYIPARRAARVDPMVALRAE
ncbi:MAG TPA: ABC transporter permease [Longimicrobiaceae bacterium]|nr:ABC transporter permease [Longimicrobiaceae bacterium]